MTTYVLPRGIDPATIACAVAAPDRKRVACSIAGAPPFVITFATRKVWTLSRCGNAAPYAWTADGLYLRDSAAFYRWHKRGGMVALPADPGVPPGLVPLSSLVAKPPPPVLAPERQLPTDPEELRKALLEYLLREKSTTKLLAGGFTARMSPFGVVLRRNGEVLGCFTCGNPPVDVAVNASETLIAIAHGNYDDGATGTWYTGWGSIDVYRISDSWMMECRKFDHEIASVRFDDKDELLVEEGRFSAPIHSEPPERR